MRIKKEVLVLVFLVLIVFSVNYSFLDGWVSSVLKSSEMFFIERVIDGDTAVSNGTSIRFLGINTPEKGEKFYLEAKNFLENLILKKEVSVEFGKEKYDLYGRFLCYVFYKGENVNIELVRNGFANIYLLEDRNHEAELRNAWEECLEKGINLCEMSEDKCSQCVELKNFGYGKDVELVNNCEFDCSLENWEIKDEGRKKFIFGNFILETGKSVEILIGEGKDTEERLYWKDETYVWTKTGDSLFLRDDVGKLILWKSY